MQCRGFAAFVAAASNLTEVVVMTQDKDSAVADSILCASSSVLTIRSKPDAPHFYMPRKLPQQVQQLSVSFRSLAEYQDDDDGFPELQPRFEAFLGMVSSMPDLRMLSIDCASLALNCGLRPPRLARLDLHFCISPTESQLGLSWLHGQQHDELGVTLHMHARGPEVSQQAVFELQQVHISKLHLVMSEFPLAAQHIWRTYSPSDHFHLELDKDCTMSEPIYALPLCKSLKLTDGRIKRVIEPFAPVMPRPLVILWQALARPGSLHIWQHAGNIGVQIRGFSGRF